MSNKDCVQRCSLNPALKAMYIEAVPLHNIKVELVA